MKLISTSFIFLFVTVLLGQTTKIDAGVALNSGVSTKSTLPFWATVNQYGAIPNSSYGSLNTYIGSAFQQPTSHWDFAYRGSFTGYVAKENLAFVNELYGSVRFRGLILTVGNKYDETRWQGLSSSNGNFLKSLNARAMPGINIETNGFVTVGFWKDWFSVRANYGEYLMNDNRIVEGTHAHNKSLHLKFKTSESFNFSVGLDDWAQWGGTSPIYGEQLYDFETYVKMVFGQGGGNNEFTDSDKVNALGNHMGNYLVELNHLGEGFNWNFYWSHPFEDGSGRELQNWSDALYGIAFDFKNPLGLINHLVTEVTYTRNASGSSHHTKDENGNDVPARGRDQYFKNSQYNSGWSYFGRTLGTPYIITELNEEGIAKGPDLSYNRFLALNIGAKGYFNKIVPYKFLLSYIHYYPWFDEEFETTPTQFSGFAEVNISPLFNWALQIEVGTSFDLGDRLPNNIGGFLKISKNLSF